MSNMSLAKHRIIITKKKKNDKKRAKIYPIFCEIFVYKAKILCKIYAKSAQVFKAKFYQSLATIPPFACVAITYLPT